MWQGLQIPRYSDGRERRQVLEKAGGEGKGKQTTTGGGFLLGDGEEQGQGIGEDSSICQDLTRRQRTEVDSIRK